MEITHQNINIVGDFNPAIIQPKWLAMQKIYEGEIGTDLNLTNRTFRYCMLNTGVYWELVNRSFLIYNKNPLEPLNKINLGFVKAIFEKLKFTPIDAIGYNIHAKINDHKIFGEKISQIRLETSKKEKPSLTSFTNRFEYKGKTFLINIEETNNDVTAKINFERKIYSLDTTKEINQFIDELGDFYNYAKEFIKSA